ncbi:MAG: phage tail tape measure protein [Parcubacteria group bacterium]|jgi:TP901 family phage tail tape measure protein
MASTDSTLNVVVKAKDQASGPLQNLAGMLNKVGNSGSLAGVAMAGLGVAAAGMAIKIGVDAVKAAVAFESKMSEVRKTTGLSATETKAFGKEILDMSKTLPVAAGNLADIAAVAGQLGIQGTKNIKDFTDIIAKATVALPEFSGGAEEIALVVAKAQNVFRLTVKQSENLLSVWNELSNTTAANASEISKFTQNVGGAASMMKITAWQVAALGATLVSLGEDGYDAGTRVSSAIIYMQKHLDDAAKLAGKSSAEFKKSLDENALSAVMDVIKGLEKIPSSTDKNLAAIEVFGQIGGKVMTKLTGNLDQLNSGLKTSKTQWSDNTSLAIEFGAASETTAMQMQLFKNNIDALSVTLGSTFLPAINRALQRITALVQAMSLLGQGNLKGALNVIVKSEENIDAFARGAVYNTSTKANALVTAPIKNATEIISSMSSKAESLKSSSRNNPLLKYNPLLGFADGGVVPGPKGSPTMAMVHGGERITPPGKNEGLTMIFDLRGATMTDKDFITRIKSELNKAMNFNRLAN